MEDPLLPIHNSTTSDVVDGTSAAAFSTTKILLRLSAVVAIAAVSLWANYEASKGFELSIVNAAGVDSHAGRRFDLMFVSNGEADRIVYRASQFVENALYPDESYPRKPVGRVKLHFAGRDLDTVVDVIAGSDVGDFVIYLSPSLMSAPNAATALAAAMHRGVARVWLWNGRGTAPGEVIDAMVEYLAVAAGFPPTLKTVGCDVTCWSEGLLRDCESRRSGFVAELNRGMRERWTEDATDGELGSAARRACEALTTQRMESNHAE
ncbi:uncharacterized protein [Typha angustifolia]|uniref:uncharacterized protein n=1 Tax=Typha angustifolia TaxID=59011 RepID=UPI003C2CC03A